MPQVSNRFFVTAIKDGQVASGYLLANMALQQFYNPDTKTCDPDWNVDMVNGEDKTNHPIITAYTRLGGATKVPTTYTDADAALKGYGWFWNNARISFNGNNSTQTYTKNGTAYPLFIRGTDSDGLPTLKINGNIASASNPDQDVISYRGTLESNGEQLDFSLDILVRSSQLANSGWQGFVNFLNNIGDITVDNNSVTLLPVLYLGTAQKTAGEFQVKWYIEGVSDYHGDSRFDTFKYGSQTDMGLTLTEADIVDNVTVRCDFYDKASPQPNYLCSAYQEVDDKVDDDYMYISHPTGQSNANLRKGEHVTFTIYMGSWKNPSEVKSAYTNFKVKLLSSASQVITNQLSTILDPNDDPYNPGSITDGYMDITKTNNDGDNHKVIDSLPLNAKYGQVTIDFDTATNNGDSVSGIIVAS